MGQVEWELQELGLLGFHRPETALTPVGERRGNNWEQNMMETPGAGIKGPFYVYCIRRL